ncbi:MAG: hypothetical protein FWE23_00435 [Chitinivibrionia bacterium]|nr:hypothetical protein [Chitinivibrionia bacterium]
MRELLKKQWVFNVLAAAVVLPLMIGCGKQQQTAPTGGSATGRIEVVSIQDELVMLCNNDFAELNFCGIGSGTSNSESMARQIAAQEARGNLALEVQADVNGRVGIWAANDPSGNALETAAQHSISNIDAQLRNIRTRSTRTEFDPTTRRFTAHVLLTTSRDEALETARQAMLANEELQRLARSLNVALNVEYMLGISREPRQAQ